MRYLLLPGCLVSGQLLAHVSQMMEESVNSSQISLISQEYIEHKFPMTRSNCLKPALKQFIQVCLKGGIESVDTDLRVNTAIHLSICEFESSGLTNYPLECQKTHYGGINPAECVKALEQSPQWWTTYSGNYQNLPLICMENSLPFEKEQILELFLNVTDMYSLFQDEVANRWKMFTVNIERESKDSLADLQASFNSMMSDLKEERRIQEEEVRAEVLRTGEMLELKLSEFILSFQTADSELKEGLNYMKRQINKTFEYLGSEYENNLREHQEKTKQSFEDLENISLHAISRQEPLYRGVNDFLSELIDLSRQTNLIIHDELTQVQEETILTIHHLNKLVEESVMPLLSEQLVPAVNDLSHSLFETLAHINVDLNEQLDDWSGKITSKFDAIDQRLEISLKDVDKVTSSLQQFNKLIGTSLMGMKHAITLFNMAFKWQVVVVASVQIIFRKHIPPVMYFYTASIITTAILGSKVGTWASKTVHSVEMV